jgi:competence protein ComEC
LLWQGKLRNNTDGISATDTTESPTGLLATMSQKFLTPLRGGIMERLFHHLPTREASLLAAVLLGQKDSGSSHIREPFQRLGLAHLFAVSGLHVGIVLALIFFAARPLSPGPRVRFIGTASLLCIYVILTGMPSSVLRASALAIMFTCSPLLGRRLDSLHALAVLFWVSCQWAPYCIHDIGLRLSYLAAVGIVVMHRIVGPLIAELPALWRWLFASLMVTIAAQWFTLPEIATSFGWLNPLAPAANLLAVPIFTLAVWMGVCGLVLSLVIPPLAADLMAASWLLWRLLQLGASGVSGTLPVWVGVPVFGPVRCASFLFLSLLLLAVLKNMTRLRTRGLAVGRELAIAALLWCGLFFLLPLGRTCVRGKMTAIQFDVGQGDCGLLVFPDRWSLLIDTGPTWPGGSAWEWSVRPWLDREGITRIQAVALTHGHADHVGAASLVMDRYRVEQWWCGGQADPPPEAASCGRPRIGESLHAWGPWALICLYAPAGTDSLGENDHSLVLALFFQEEMAALWSGDLEERGEEILLRKTSPLLRTREVVWKAGHHGSDTSGTQAFLSRFQPSLILTSCGVENRHGHPSHTPYVVQGDTVPMLRTDLDGTILIQWDQKGNFEWEISRSHGLSPWERESGRMNSQSRDPGASVP